MKANPQRFWFIVILLGWAFDFLFWKKPFGINFAIYVMLCLITGVFLLKTDGLRLSPRSGLLLPPIAFLAAVTFFRAEPMTVFLSVAMTIFLMGVFALTYTGGRWMQYNLSDYILGYLSLFGSMLVRPLGFAADTKRDQPNVSPKRMSQFWPVVRGIVIAIPVIAVFASLLASADVVFAERLETFLKFFNIKNLPETIFRLVYILVFAYALAGTFLHAAQKSSDEKISADAVPGAGFLGFVEAAIVLGSMAVLFTSFVVIQFQYFFGGQENINYAGYTFSEYARRGFGELVTVAFFSLLLLLGLGKITRRETNTQRSVFSGLGTGLVLLVIVMLISAFQRLILYETAYGFSRLRTYTHVFMIWLALLLVTVAVFEILRREQWIWFTMVLASAGFVISLGLLNVDAFIVKQNIQRELEGRTSYSSESARADLDNEYFTELSDDAIPPLVSAYLDQSLPEATHEKIGGALACKNYERTNEDRELPWQGFHFSHFNAALALEKISGELEGYKIVSKEYPTKAISPSGEEYSCWPNYD